MCKDAIIFNNKPKGTKLEAGVEYLICACGRSKDGVFCDGSHSFYTDEDIGKNINIEPLPL
ncbi:CDGSH iron-sulfur domain-containing protein [Sulfurimonas sp. CS5]|uniref:CDGSH iron-sulfur domain-containing protein n=1 Tax=Sulfurimonas sp. CS5 TaxID=3391145 RepID=UPI0039E8806A